MTIALARQLYQVGRSHAGAACLLYRAAVEHAAQDGADDPISVAFNGPNSLSINYLLGLGFELILKAAIVAGDDGAGEKYLQNEVRHDLVKALDEAEKRGFVSAAPHLRSILRRFETRMRNTGCAIPTRKNSPFRATLIRSWQRWRSWKPR